jgi:hypothetical protein
MINISMKKRKATRADPQGIRLAWMAMWVCDELGVVAWPACLEFGTNRIGTISLRKAAGRRFYFLGASPAMKQGMLQ